MFTISTKKALATVALATSAVISTPIFACNFSYEVQAASGIKQRIEAELPSLITDEFCRRASKTHTILIMAEVYHEVEFSLGYASVGLQRKGEDNLPRYRHSSYSLQNGRFNVGTAHVIAAQAAKKAVMDMMSNVEKSAQY